MFQSTLPARGSDKDDNTTKPTAKCFNPRSPRGGATIVLFRVSIQWCFNPRSPRGGATKKRATGVLLGVFQSTLPARGSDVTRLSVMLIYCMFQSTLPARGSDDILLGIVAARVVSIHAPREGERQQLGFIGPAE